MAEAQPKIDQILKWDRKEVHLHTSEGKEFEPGAIKFEPVVFTVQNISNEPVEIKDVVLDCICMDVVKEPKKLNPKEHWSFHLDIKIPKYGIERDVKVLVSTDKGKDNLKVTAKGDPFVTLSSKELSWGTTDLTPKDILIQTKESNLTVSEVKTLGNGFTTETLPGLKGVPVIRVTPIEGKFHKGMLKMKVSNGVYTEEQFVRLTTKKD
jgi:hypothetical protein